MKGWIELHILTHTEDSYKLQELGLDVEEDNMIFKKNLVQISCIQSIGLSSESTGIIYLNEDPVETKETVEEIISLIKNNQ